MLEDEHDSISQKLSPNHCPIVPPNHSGMGQIQQCGVKLHIERIT